MFGFSRLLQVALLAVLLIGSSETSPVEPPEVSPLAGEWEGVRYDEKLLYDYHIELDRADPIVGEIVLRVRSRETGQEDPDSSPSFIRVVGQYKHPEFTLLLNRAVYYGTVSDDLQTITGTLDFESTRLDDVALTLKRK